MIAANCLLYSYPSSSRRRTFLHFLPISHSLPVPGCFHELESVMSTFRVTFPAYQDHRLINYYPSPSTFLETYSIFRITRVKKCFYLLIFNNIIFKKRGIVALYVSSCNLFTPTFNPVSTTHYAYV